MSVSAAYIGDTTCGTGSNNLTKVFLSAMQGLGGLTSKKEKFLSFGANGVAICQRIRVGVIVQLQREVVPFVVAIQCCSLKTKLAMLMVSRIVIVQRMGYLLATLYTYFSKLPKKVS